MEKLCRPNFVALSASLQPGDYTTRDEIVAYAERAGLTVEQGYLRICDALVGAGADIGERLGYVDRDALIYYGWSTYSNGILFASDGCDHRFTRHLTPEQILSAGKQEDLQSEKQADKIAPKQIGELTAGIRLATDLQATIHDYIYLLNKTYDEKARQLIESQLVDLMNLEYQRFNGENENA